MVPNGGLRKNAGRNESEPRCSAVTNTPRPGGEDWERRAYVDMAKTGTAHCETGYLAVCWTDTGTRTQAPNFAEGQWERGELAPRRSRDGMYGKRSR